MPTLPLVSLFHSATGYAAHRLDDRRLTRDGGCCGPRRFQTGGRLRVQRWKGTLTEAGDLQSSNASRGDPRRTPRRHPDRTCDVDVLRPRARELATHPKKPLKPEDVRVRGVRPAPS